jgi:hypothetical protein
VQDDRRAAICCCRSAHCSLIAAPGVNGAQRNFTAAIIGPAVE